MPQALVRRELFGISLAHWIVLAASLVIPFVLLMALARAVVFLAGRVSRDPVRRSSLAEWYAVTRWPAIIVLTLAIQLTAMRVLGFPLVFRIAYAHVGLVAGVIALTWLLRRILRLGFARARSAVWGRDSTSTQSLMMLGERLIQALILIVALMAILTIVGVNTKAALAGLGIGGVALALGAQKTVENLLGGVFLLSDRALAVGDTCSSRTVSAWSKTSRCGRYESEQWSRHCCRFQPEHSRRATSRTSPHGERSWRRPRCACGMAPRPSSADDARRDPAPARREPEDRNGVVARSARRLQ